MSKAVLKVILLGDSNVGKTSIANRYVNNTFTRDYKATIGADIFQKSLWIDKTEVFLQIWDTAGQERFQSLGAGYFRGADACILVYDVTNQRSFESISGWCAEFVRHASLEDVDKFPFFVLGNKSDLTDRRQVRKDDADGWCKENIAGPNGEQVHFETSALNGEQVEAAFIALCKRTLERESPVMPLYDIERNKEALHNLDNPPKMPTPPPAPPTPPAPEPERIYIQATPPPQPSYDLEYGLHNCCGYEMNLNMTNVERRRRRRRRERRGGRETRTSGGRDRRERRDRGERRGRTTASPEPGQSRHDPDDINEDDEDFDEDIPAPAAPAGGGRAASTRRSRGRHDRQKSRASNSRRSRRRDRSNQSSRSRSRRQEGEVSDDSD